MLPYCFTEAIFSQPKHEIFLTIKSRSVLQEIHFGKKINNLWCKTGENLEYLNNIKCTNTGDNRMFNNTRWPPAVNNLIYTELKF